MNSIHNCPRHDLKIPNIVDSQGIYLSDESEKGYLDLEAGVWCTSPGHKNPGINDTIIKQIDAIMHLGFCYSHNILLEAAKSVWSVTNFEGGKFVFLCSCSEAIEKAALNSIDKLLGGNVYVPTRPRGPLLNSRDGSPLTRGHSGRCFLHCPEAWLSDRGTFGLRSADELLRISCHRLSGVEPWQL